MCAAASSMMTGLCGFPLLTGIKKNEIAASNNSAKCWSQCTTAPIDASYQVSGCSKGYIQSKCNLSHNQVQL